jgi:quinol monooxygenase YgiN
MLIIGGRIELDPARRDEYLAAAEQNMRDSRADAGCIDYVMSADPLEPGRVYLFERWESKEHLAAHLERARAAQGSRQGPPVPVLSSELRQYEIAAEGPIGS